MPHFNMAPSKWDTRTLLGGQSDSVEQLADECGGKALFTLGDSASCSTCGAESDHLLGLHWR